MWYESLMVNETLDSLMIAISNTNSPVDIKVCLNSQTYIESPIHGNAYDMFNEFINHPVLKNAHIINKTNDDSFYNIGDWRREVYDNKYKYIVWGESDTLIPMDYFYILDNIEINEPHILSLSSRKMWDASWIMVEHCNLQNIESKHDMLGILSCGAYIAYDQLCELNNASGDIVINKLSTTKIDGSMLALSKELPTPFIAPEQNFISEDTCAAEFFNIKNIPQYHITNRLKGHNYNHPMKRSNTNNTRHDDLFKLYADKSRNAMNEYLKSIV